MNLDRLYEILAATTAQFRNQAEELTIEDGPVRVVDMNINPPVSAARPSLVVVDMVLLSVGVDKVAAEKYKDELVAILKEYPEPERLAGGPNYMEVGAAVGDQGAAFQLFALGQVLGLWKVITPAFFGMTGDEAKNTAGMGFIMITGFKA